MDVRQKTIKNEIREIVYKNIDGRIETDKKIGEFVYPTRAMKEAIVYNIKKHISQNYIPKDRVLTRDEIMGVLARGYCTKRNRYKVSDPDLIADQVDALLKAGSIEVGVEEIYEELKNWGGNIQSSQSLTSEEMDEFLKDIAQSINNLKEKE